MIGWSAVAISAVVLVTTAVSLDNFGQMSNFLWLPWIVGTSSHWPGDRAEAPAEVALA